MSARATWKIWGVSALLLWQSLAFSMDEAAAKPRWRRACSVIVAGVVLAGTAAGIVWHTWSGSDPTPVTLTQPEGAPIEVERDELAARLDALDVLVAREGGLSMPLTTESGGPPSLVLFDKNFLQKIIAGKVKDKIRAKYPGAQLPPGPALTIRIRRLVIQEIEGRADVVRIGTGGDFMTMFSSEPVEKARLLSGNVVHVDLGTFTEPVDGGGEAVVEAKIAVRFVPGTGHFEILEGMGAFRVTVPGQCNERDVGSLPKARTAPVIAPRRP